MNQYFPPYTARSESVKIKLDLTNYATKAYLKTNLAAFKSEVDKLDIDIAVPGDLSKLSKEAQEDFTKKTDFNTLKTKVDGIHTTKFVSKTKYDSEVGDLKLKIPDISALLQNSTFNSKITEIENKITTAEGKIPDISGSTTKGEVTNVENKIPDTDAFVKRIMQQKQK